jgi:hypothetical protein
MGKVDELKARDRAARLDDPHGWAERIEREITSRSLVGAIAFFLSVFLAANVWLLWQSRDNLKERVERLEAVTNAPPPGFVLSE